MSAPQLGLFDLKEVMNIPVSSASSSVRRMILAPSREQRIESPIISPVKTLENTLQHIFPTTQEETRFQKARRIMGDAVESLTDEELQIYLTEFQYLIDAWLDDFEKQAFQGSTLIDALKEE